MAHIMAYTKGWNRQRDPESLGFPLLAKVISCYVSLGVEYEELIVILLRDMLLDLLT